MRFPEPGPRGPSRRAWHVLLPAGVAQLALIAALAWSPSVDGTVARATLFVGAFAAYAAAAVWLRRTAGGMVLVWGVAIALRAVVLPAASDPALAEGLLYPAGGAPTPGPTPHPPLAQLAFLAIALAGGAIFQAKLLWLGLDLGTGWLLGRIAYLTGRSRRLTQLLYLWSPLLVVEVGWNGDPAPLALLPLVLVVLLARAPGAAGVAAGLSAMAAPVALAAVPGVAGRLGARFLLGCAGGVLVVALPYVAGWRQMLGGLSILGGAATGLAGPYLLLESALPGEAAPRWAALAVVLGVSAWAATRRLRPERAILWVMGAAILLSPALSPSDALWILPFAALRLSVPWLLFTGCALFGHLGTVIPGPDGGMSHPVWVQLLVWLPITAFLARGALVAWRERFPAFPGSVGGSPEGS